MWAKIHKFIFVVSFFCFSSSFDDNFKQQCNIILKSFTIGNYRQEHVLMKTHQLMSGFTLNSPVTWELEEQSIQKGTLSKIIYKEDGILKCQAKLITKSEQKSLDDLILEKENHLSLAVEGKTTTIKNETKTLVGPLDGYRIDFELHSDNMPSAGIFYFAPHNDEWFSGYISLCFLYSPTPNNDCSLDLCCRSAASLAIPLDPLDEDDRNSRNLYTYENLNFGFRFQFNKDKYKPKVTGASIKLIPIESQSMISWPMPELSGTLCPMITEVTASDDIPLIDFVNGIRDFTQDGDTVVLELKSTKIDNCDAMKMTCLQKKHLVRLTNHVFRKDGHWFLIRWQVKNSEIKNEVFIEEIVNSFHYFGVILQ